MFIPFTIVSNEALATGDHAFFPIVRCKYSCRVNSWFVVQKVFRTFEEAIWLAWSVRIENFTLKEKKYFCFYFATMTTGPLLLGDFFVSITITKQHQTSFIVFSLLVASRIYAQNFSQSAAWKLGLSTSKSDSIINISLVKFLF